MLLGCVRCLQMRACAAGSCTRAGALPGYALRPPWRRPGRWLVLLPCRLLREQLERSWRQLQPTCDLLCRQAGVTSKPDYHDFKWACSIWW